MSRYALHLITTGRQELEEVKKIVSSCPMDMVDVLHIREKHRTARELLQWYEELSALVGRTAIYINDRLDTAAAVKAPGVQLAYHSLPPQLARSILDARTKIGCSVHSAEEAREAEAAGADYVIFGHIFATRSKEGLQPRGIGALSDVTGAVSIPVIAIGGIEPDRTALVLENGCAGIAVMSSVFLHPDPAGQIVKFRSVLDSFK